MKKRMGCIILMIAMLVAIFPATLSMVAFGEQQGSYTYKILDGTATIEAFDKTISGALEIPSTLGGYPVTSIGDRAFNGCGRLTSVTIPNGVISIGDRVFNECTGLKRIDVDVNNQYYSSDNRGVLFDKAKSVLINYPAASSEVNYIIPSSVASIGTNAFYGCTGLKRIDVDVNNQYYSSDNRGVLFDKAKSVLINYPVASSEANYIIPNSVTSIGDYAFKGCSSLMNITIPNSVTSIGDRAFNGCGRLTSVTIPNGVISIGTEAFSSCSGLKRIDVDVNNQYYSSDNRGVLFDKAKSVLINYPTASSEANYIIPNSVTSIGANAFYGCSSLTNITIPNSVTRIEEGVFYECGRLTSLTIPSSVASIGDRAFYECTELKRIDVDANNQYYSSDNCGVLFDKVKSVLINYPARSSEANYIIPNSVTSIGPNAFPRCESLTNITIPNSVTSIGTEAFFSCTGLKRIDVDANNQYYSSDNRGVLFDKAKSVLINYPVASSEVNYIIPSSVISIGDRAFNVCSSLTNVTIPNSVTSIGDHAFDGCISLTSVTIPSSVTFIGNDAFYGCSRLTNITISNSVTYISDYAFSGCGSLTSVTIPNSVTSIGYSAFYGCSKLKDVYYEGTQAQWNNISSGLGNEVLFSANIHYNYIPPESNKIDAIGSYVDKVEIKKEIVDDKAIFTITVLGDATVDLSKITLHVAEYNSVKTLIRFNTGTNLVTDGKLVITADLPKTEIYKYMLWDHNQVPIIDGISKINGSK